MFYQIVAGDHRSCEFLEVMAKSLTTWKKRLIKQAAIEYKLKAATIRIVARDSTLPIYATWEMLQPVLCPINNKHYHLYWVRTNEQFRQSADCVQSGRRRRSLL